MSVYVVRGRVAAAWRRVDKSRDLRRTSLHAYEAAPLVEHGRVHEARNEACADQHRVRPRRIELRGQERPHVRQRAGLAVHDVVVVVVVVIAVHTGAGQAGHAANGVAVVLHFLIGRGPCYVRTTALRCGWMGGDEARDSTKDRGVGWWWWWRWWYIALVRGLRKRLVANSAPRIASRALTPMRSNVQQRVRRCFRLVVRGV